MNISMLTWNVDWLRNGRRTGKDWEYLVSDCSGEVYTKIVNIVKEYLDMNECAIVFLNEFPYKVKVNGVWNESEYFKELKNDFPIEKYDIRFNNKFVTRLTLCISKKDIYEENNIEKLNDNRIISVKKGDLILIGVHMPTNFSENDNDDFLWSALKNYISKYNNSVIALGDFNSYDGCDDKLTEDRYKQILSITEDMVSEDEITYIGDTLIDHVLVKNITNAEKAIVQKDFNLSDHKYVTFCLNV